MPLSKFIKKTLFIAILLILTGGFSFVSKANAATNLSTASDTVTTSRPSAAAPLATDQAASASFADVVDLPTSGFNSALWLASDSAVLFADTGQSLSTATVASMSANGVPSANQRRVYFTSTVTNTHHKGTVMTTGITATHQIKFTTNTNIPSGGKIIITFPGSGSNSASPSATGFNFNNESATPTDTTCYDVTGAGTCGGSVASNQLNTFTFTTGTTIAGGHQVIVNIGCTGQTSGVCTTFAPRLVNPIKTSAASGTGDQWKILVQTADSGSVILDQAKVVVATIESVQVQGTVEPYITFTIAGVANGASACSDTTNPGPGLDSTATFVNLGSITNAINISAQTLSVDTNGGGGYAITATSSGTFIDAATGFAFNDANGGTGLTGNSAANGTAPAPGTFTAGTTAFGIHPCFVAGSYAPTIPGGWSTGATGGGAGAKYANPWNNPVGNGYYAALSSYAGPAASSQTRVEYAATAALTFPAGTYTTVFTYVATPIF